jgi:hypothetical protein
MSNIEELRLRLEDAERRFGLNSAEANQYSVRLVRLVDAIVDDLWVQRRDNERLNFENEEFRSMLLTLLASIEGGDKEALRTMMTDMAERLANLMAAGAGVPAYDPVLNLYPEPAFDPEPEPGPEPVAEPEIIPVPEVVPESVPEAEVLVQEEAPVAEEAPVQVPAADIMPDNAQPAEINVDTITAAVAELANSTDAVAPVLDLGAASPPPAPAVAAPLPEAIASPPVEAEPENTQVSELAVPGEPKARPVRKGEFADLHSVLDDIRELVGLMEDVDHPTSAERGQL